jgi:hypothetical protein
MGFIRQPTREFSFEPEPVDLPEPSTSPSEAEQALPSTPEPVSSPSQSPETVPA